VAVCDHYAAAVEAGHKERSRRPTGADVDLATDRAPAKRVDLNRPGFAGGSNYSDSDSEIAGGGGVKLMLADGPLSCGQIREGWRVQAGIAQCPEGLVHCRHRRV